MAQPIHATSVQAAISVAIDVARRLGLTVEEPVLLRSTNNVVARLRPANVVAKVSGGGNSRLLADLQVARELAALGGPVVSPTPLLRERARLCDTD